MLFTGVVFEYQELEVGNRLYYIILHRLHACSALGLGCTMTAHYADSTQLQIDAYTLLGSCPISDSALRRSGIVDGPSQPDGHAIA